MKSLAKNLRQLPQRRILHHPMHALVTSSTISGDISWMDNLKKYRNCRQYSVLVEGKPTLGDKRLARDVISFETIRFLTPQVYCLNDSSRSKHYTQIFHVGSTRNFSSSEKTESSKETSSTKHDDDGVSSHESKQECSSTNSKDSPPLSDSPDSSPTKKERLQNAAQRGKNAVSKGALSLRGLVQKYGWTFVGTYMGVYFFTLGSLFISVDSGLIDPVTITSIEWPWHSSSGVEDASTSSDQKDFDSAVEFVASYMKKFPWTAPYSDFVLRNPHMANLGIAWVATKLTEPIRLPVSIAIVRKIKKDKDDDT